MTYFTIGESDGGSGERRLGPFSTPDEAAQAGRKETRESNGTFVFRGVVDEANNQVQLDVRPIVSTNSVVRNAMAVKNATAQNASGDDKSRFFRELDKIKSKVRDGLADTDDLLFEAEQGEYEGYELARFKARIVNQLADKLWDALTRR